MTITQHGPICDVGGEYILLPSLGFGEIHAFHVAMSDATMHVCDEHKPILVECSDKNDWRLLPEGPLRRGYADAQARIDAMNEEGARHGP